MICKKTKIFIAVFVTVLGGILITSQSFAEPVNSSDKFNQLQSILDKSITSGLPGISMAIANTKGIVWSGVAGWYDREQKIPISKEHLFGIGSITKTFTAVVIMQLAEEGLLDLNATPEEILVKEVTQGIANTDKATLLQLLNHTAGVPTWELDKAWIPEGRGKLMVPDNIWEKSEPLIRRHDDTL